MRDILFQAKCEYDEEWVEGYFYHDKYFVDDSKNDDLIIGKKDGVFFREYIKSDTIRQFTGLPDKENKRIFEADIFKTDDGHIGVVTFGAYKQDGAQHYGFYIKWNDEQLRKDILYWIDKGCVVGNVHDNPELLEGTT